MADEDDRANKVLGTLANDPHYGTRCKWCLSIFHLDKQGHCTQPDCVAKASRERTEILLAKLRARRQR